MSEQQLVVLADKREVIERVARDARHVLAQVLSESNEAHLVLTGGTVGIGVLAQLGATDDGSVDWACVHLWWGDERWLPEGDDERNDEQARPVFLEALPFVPNHVHRMPASNSGHTLHEGASWYAQQLSELALGAELPKFDLVFLGVGPDAHVASLFPGHPEGRESPGTVIAVRDSPKPPPERLSLTLHAINSATRVWLIAAGDDKAEAIARARGRVDFTTAPASAVRGVAETRIYCDSLAARPSSGD